MISRRELARLAVASVAALSIAAGLNQASAQEDYPTDPVSLVVPFPAGGGTDTVARALGERLSERLGQPIIVENKPGAGSLIGAEFVANAEPDGYTLLMATASFLTNVVLGDQKPYDPRTDFEPAALVSLSPALLVVNPSLEVSTLEEFLELARSKPGELKFASYGKNSQSHLVATMLQNDADLDLRHIPYSGGNPAVTATLNGEVDLLMSSIIPVLPHIEAGNLVPIALAASERSQAIPDVPTFSEQGLDFQMGTWFGVAAPAGTPEAILDKLHTEIVAVLSDEELRQEWESRGSMVPDMSRTEFGEFIASEHERWSTVQEKGLLE